MADTPTAESLRTLAHSVRRSDADPVAVYSALMTAADEIERLRAARKGTTNGQPMEPWDVLNVDEERPADG